MEQKAAAAPLHPNEEAELTMLKRELAAGIVELSIDSIACHGVSAGGNTVDEIDIMDLSVDALGSALAIRLQDEATPKEAVAARAQGLDDMRARRAGVPNLPSAESDLPLWALDDELDVTGEVGMLEAGGVASLYGTADHAAAEGVTFRGNQDVLGLTAASAQADGVDGMGAHAEHIQGGAADIRVRGNDVGGHIRDVSGQDLNYAGTGLSASASDAHAHAIHFDADAASQRLRSGRIESGHATDLDYEDASQHVVAARAAAQRMDAQGVSTAGADHVGIEGVDLDAGHYTRHAQAASVDADGKAVEAVSGIDAGFDTARLDDVHLNNATSSGTGAVDIGQVHATGVDGQMHGTGSGHAREVLLNTVHAERHADGAMDARVDQLTATGVHGNMPGTGAGEASRVDLHDLNAALEADGSGSVDLSGGSVDDLVGVYGESILDPTAVGQVDRVTFGHAGVDFNEDYEVTGAEVNDLQGAGITAELLKLPLNEVSEGEEAAPADTFHADALAGMSGQVKLEIPFGERGYVEVSIAAEEGFVAFNTLQVHHRFAEGESGIRTPLAALASSVQVDEGRGVVIGVGPVNLSCVMDDREYDGLVSRRQGGGRRGGIEIQAFIEGIMNGVVTGEEELAEELSRVERRTARRHRRRDRRDKRRASRRGEPDGTEADVSLQEMLTDSVADIAPTADNLGLRIRPSATRIVGITADLGSGTLGYDGMSVKMDDSVGDNIRISGTLDSSMTAVTQVWSATNATYRLENGSSVDANDLGLRGVRLTVNQPLSTERSVEVHASQGEVSRVTYGSRGSDE